ncbi:MAG: YdcF family protein [Acidimicrobiales bacterium]|nr:YdcF family protein [Acidimicrobiales bacterium]
MTPRRLLRWALRAAVAVLALGIVYLAVTFVQVWWVGRHDGKRPADAIVVLGAAQYDGRPSLVLQARLDHALELRRDGYADVIVVTGGNQPGDRFTEATASANYLLARGVPDDQILREVSGGNSWESLAATAVFLDDRGIDRVILVSDPYHSMRIEGIASELGLDASVSPTRTSPTRGWSELRAMVRETAAVGVGRLIGYRRLLRLEEVAGGGVGPLLGVVGALGRVAAPAGWLVR